MRILAWGIAFLAVLGLLGSHLLHHRDTGDRGRASGAFYWERMLGVQGFPVAESDEAIVFSWRHHHGAHYYTVDRTEAEAAYADAVARHIETLIGYMESEVRREGHTWGDYGVSLQALTGQALGDDPEMWRRWWDAERATFRAAPDAYAHLIEARIEHEIAMGERHSFTRDARASAAAAYQRYRRNRWLNALLWCLLAAPVVVEVMRRWPHRRRRSIPL